MAFRNWVAKGLLLGIDFLLLLVVPPAAVVVVAQDTWCGKVYNGYV